MIDGPQSDLNYQNGWITESHEEADNRIVVHIHDILLKERIKKVVVRSVDTDVLVILLAFMPQFLETDHGQSEIFWTSELVLTERSTMLTVFIMILVILSAWDFSSSTVLVDVIQHLHS